MVGALAATQPIPSAEIPVSLLPSPIALWDGWFSAAAPLSAGLFGVLLIAISARPTRMIPLPPLRTSSAHPLHTK